MISSKEMRSDKKLFENVEVWTQQYVMPSHRTIKSIIVRMLERNLSGDYPEYAQQQLDELENGNSKLNEVSHTGRS